MTQLSIEAGLALLCLLVWPVFRWGFRHLPGEGWQIAWVIPARRPEGDGRRWPAVNITFYGVISAVAYTVAALAYVFLMGAHGQPLGAAAVYAALLLALGVPASKWMTKLIEGQRGHTIGGAVFVAIVAALPALALTQEILAALGLPPLDGAVTVACAAACYVLGESIGRLACLSFGCCYGKPIAQCTPLQRALYGPTATVYRGRMKKIAYESNLAEEPVVAVQSIACVLLFALFVIAVWLLWRGWVAASLIVAVSGSQLWRAYSETLRADFRGREGFTAYQGMAVVAALLAPLYAWWLQVEPGFRPVADARAGWTAVFRIEVLLTCQALGLAMLYLMGRSYVTSARLDFELHLSSSASQTLPAGQRALASEASSR
ncbi:MAG: hypothetical protein N3F11_01115 [Casimicrobiaceae bacterium]|nr:hypothetical protein [Casimicrobiaceae bacterium]